MNLTPGMTVERYQVENLLGMGGMAEVWAVRHTVLQTRYALKVLLRADPVLQQRLLQEGRAQASLDHPNLLPVRDILDLNGQPGLLLPLIEGPSLEKLLRIYQPNRIEALAIFLAIVDGLAYAHRNGFVHRDLKTANVLLDLSGGVVVPRLGDFGLAKSRSPETPAATKAGAVFGTLAYAAPEQLEDASAVDQRADLWSLGVIWVELLLGRRPFPETSLYSLQQAHHRPNFDDLLPEDAQIASALLQVRPDDRVPTCAALRKLLGETSRYPHIMGEEGSLMRAARMTLADTEEPSTHNATWITTNPSIPPTRAPHNLPAARGPLFGRRAALDKIGARFRHGDRLLTVTGMGGMGKTQLALAFGRQALRDWPGGIWLCDLTECRSAEEICAVVASALHIPQRPQPHDAIIEELRRRGGVLLILDNFEQIVDAAMDTVGRWLDTCSTLACLITSREPLRLVGERVLPLGSLDEAAAIALFIERARAVRPDFDSAKDAASLRSLVRLLDGMPLAIELAASRSQLLPPRSLLNRLSRRFDLLKSRSPDRPARQRTLWATLAWSWEMLAPHEQQTLAQCSVFEGGFSIAAAESIVALDDADVWIEDVLAELVDKSFLQVHDERLSMLVSVQAFAATRLTDPLPTERRHGQYFGQADRFPRSGPTRAKRLLEEAANARTACTRALHRGDAHTAVGCALIAADSLLLSGPFEAGVDLLRQVRAAIPLAATQQIDLLRREGQLLGLLSQMDASIDVLQEGLRLSRQHHHTRAESWFLSMLGAAHQEISKITEARTFYRQALALLEASPNAHRNVARATVLVNLGMLDKKQGEYAQALTHYESALALTRASGGPRNNAYTLGNLAELYVALGRAREAEQTYREIIAMIDDTGDRLNTALARANLGRLLLTQDRIAEAERLIHNALAVLEQLGAPLAEGVFRGDMAEILEHRGDPNAAREALHQGEALIEKTGQRWELALLLLRAARFEHRAGDFTAARCALRRAQALCADLRVTPRSELAADLARTVALLKEH